MFAPKITSGGGGATHGTASKDGQTIKTRINKKQLICTNAAKISKWRRICERKLKITTYAEKYLRVVPIN